MKLYTLFVMISCRRRSEEAIRLVSLAVGKTAGVTDLQPILQMVEGVATQLLMTAVY